jgi:RHS repeat-associated protein
MDVAPPLDQTTTTSLLDATAFLYTGDNPIQTGVVSGTIKLHSAAVLRGKVTTRDGAALPGVRISVLGHSEFGHTLTREDGMFDLAVNGGGQLTVRYEAEGFLPAQRAIVAPWRDYAWLPDVILIPLDPVVTEIDLDAATMQVAQSSVISDTDGSRQATILFPQATTATMTLADGTTSPLTAINVRVTEFTVGDAGPAAMPAELPPSSGYTYAAEFSVDEAMTAGATGVRFGKALPIYVENFLDFPVGGAVPAGYYDHQKGQWVASANGRVIKLLSVTDGLADLDIDGDDIADTGAALTALGVTDDERARLAQLYTPGQTLWRVPISHFTPWDFNWPYGPPDDAEPPPGDDDDDDGDDNDPKPDDPNCEEGSVIGCEDQTLGESLPIAGTSWRLHYQSDRTPGRNVANTLVIPVSGPTIPASLAAMRVEVTIAGRVYRQTFAPAPNVTYIVTWDGNDAYGRPLQSAQPAVIRVYFDYPLQYYAARSDFQNSFARSAALGAAVSISRASSTFSLSRTWTKMVRFWDTPALGLGGWSLSIQHTYDPVRQTLLLGGGQRRSASALTASASIFTVAGNGSPGFSGDGGPATAARLNGPVDVAVGPDGSLYIADRLNNRIRRVGLDGVITTVVGNAGAGNSGDGGPASAARIRGPEGLAFGPDGSLYIADNANNRVRRIGPDGIITTVAGNGVQGYNGDGIPAVSAQLRGLSGIAVGADGSLYIPEFANLRVRHVGSDGIITTVAGNGSQFCGFTEGGRAIDGCLLGPQDVAVGPDGSLYIADPIILGGGDRIYRVGVDGSIHTVAGGGQFENYQDGVPALTATLERPIAVTIGRNSLLYIADNFFDFRIRRVGLDGIITTAVGNRSSTYSGDGGPATAAGLTSPSGLAIDPDGNLYIADPVSNRIRRVQPAHPNVDILDILLPSEDGSEIYVLDKSGRHLRTLDALTGALRYQFGYDSEGYLISVTDGDGNVTTIERTGAAPTAIVAPGGQRTTLSVDGNGWLNSMTNPSGETHTMSYTVDGLLTHFVDPLNNVHTFSYDAKGRLIQDNDPASGSTTLARLEGSSGYTVTTTTALGRVRAYRVEELPTGAIRRSVTKPSGAKTTTIINTDGSEQIIYSDGTVVTVKYGPDPRWGMLAPVAAETTTRTPSGRTRTVTIQRSVRLTDPSNLFSLTRMTDTVTDNGAVSRFVYNALSRVMTATTAAGRSSTLSIDAQGRVTQEQSAGLSPVSLAYDSRGLLSTLIEGSGAASRVTNLTHNDAFHLTGVSNALVQTTTLTYDAVGRPTTQTLPNGQAVAYAYDANGNLTSLTPPGRPAHSFGYTASDQMANYSPPDVNPGDDDTQFDYNAERRLTLITRPDGQTVAVSYDSAGRQSAVTIARGVVNHTYHPTTSKLTALNAPGGVNLAFSYDGPLLTGKTWSGPIAGSVGYVYDNRFRLTSTTVNGGNAIAFQYANDSLLIQAGSLTLNRNAQNGLLMGSALAGVADVWGYNGFAEPFTYTASYNAASLYSVQYERDRLGRITQKSQTIGGVTDVYSYTYDLAGQLTAVHKNGLAVETYTYDANGNRLSAASGVVAGVYDAQDRLTQYGATTYGYSAAGELMTKTNAGQTTTYNYDELGNLLGVTLTDGTAITYLVDGQNQRIGKRVNGVLTQRFLYEGNLRPIAELDGGGTLVSRFVYAAHINVPDYMIRGGVTYRILTDHLGSPRLVVDVASGVIAQRMDYDSFGKLLNDTNPGFQPFGFAGGIYDPHTKLVRFGARDYDAETGRWIAKDPIGFAGDDTNLYRYVFNDPVNFIDLTGQNPILLGAGIGLGIAEAAIVAGVIIGGAVAVGLLTERAVNYFHNQAHQYDPPNPGSDTVNPGAPTEPTIPQGDTVNPGAPTEPAIPGDPRNPTFPKPPLVPFVPKPPPGGFPKPPPICE